METELIPNEGFPKCAAAYPVSVTVEAGKTYA